MNKMNKTSGQKYAYMALGLILIAWLIMDFNVRMSRLRQIQYEREIVQENVVHLLETQAALKAQIAYAKSAQNVEKYSYEDAHKVKPGDIPIILVADRSITSLPTPRPVVSVVEQENGNAWLSLFIDP
jgi:cell division protein FtsB